jgi:ABC-type transport system involved in multi-copper enzyme maturation permease subunit
MKQILLIFRKDAIRHWPEILISLALLGIYAYWELHPKMPTASYSFTGIFLREEFIAPVLVFLWSFLTVRVVHGESLVGDRQWWVTKPYVWWKLLAAKVLFLLAFVGLPLFLVQLYLLHNSGFPILPHIGGVLRMQLILATILFLPSIALGSLTRSLAQALLGAVIVLLGAIAASYLIAQVPSSAMSSTAETPDAVQTLLLVASIWVAATWQYARRKTWYTRGLLFGAYAAIVLISVLTPYQKYVEKKYPLVDEREAPAHFAILSPNMDTGKNRRSLDFISDVSLYLSLAVSDVAPGRMVLVNGIKATIDLPDGHSWSPGWKGQWLTIWPEDDGESLLYEVTRKDYERFKTSTVRLRLELALTEYQAIAKRQSLLGQGKFSDAALGVCQLDPLNHSAIKCVRPFRPPGLMADFDPSGANCAMAESDEEVPELDLSHAWLPPIGDSFVSGINPVTDFSISFLAKTKRSYLPQDTSPRKLRVVHLCPGAAVSLARPLEGRKVRVKLEIDGVRLQDFTGSLRD